MRSRWSARPDSLRRVTFNKDAPVTNIELGSSCYRELHPGKSADSKPLPPAPQHCSWPAPCTSWVDARSSASRIGTRRSNPRHLLHDQHQVTSSFVGHQCGCRMPDGWGRVGRHQRTRQPRALVRGIPRFLLQPRLERRTIYAAKSPAPDPLGEPRRHEVAASVPLQGRSGAHRLQTGRRERLCMLRLGSSARRMTTAASRIAQASKVSSVERVASRGDFQPGNPSEAVVEVLVCLP